MMKWIKILNLINPNSAWGVLFRSLFAVPFFPFPSSNFTLNKLKMKKLVLLYAFLLVGLSGFSQKIEVLVVTGGHSFEQEPFSELFNSMEQIVWEELAQPKANQLMLNEGMGKYDVLVFYDMFQEISEEEQAAFLQLLQEGKPMLFLHHALVSYQGWDEFENILGGRYYDSGRYKGIPENGFSTYLHDTNIPVRLLAPEHPVTSELTDFTLFDEVYGNTWVSPNVTPLIGTDHPESTEIIGWEHTYAASRIIYLQPGHGKTSYENPNYRKLLYNAIMYLSK